MLEGVVWDAVRGILLDPVALRAGYEQNIEQERERQGRIIKHLETLQAAIEKLKRKRARLLEVYLDTEAGTDKELYLEQKSKIESELKAAKEQAARIAAEIEHIPGPEDLKDLEEFAGKIGAVLGEGREIPPEDKRKIVQVLNLKVLISPDGEMRLDGWFALESDGLLSKSYSCCVQQTIHFSVNVTQYRLTKADVLFRQASRQKQIA